MESIVGETGQRGQSPPPQELWGVINDLKTCQRGLLGGDTRCHQYGQQLGTAIERLQAFATTQQTTGRQLVAAGNRDTAAPPGTTGESRVT